MSRSPLAYPLNRSADMDVGGAADLQTDIMRFMAILSLCLVAIFALVQSIPLTPAEPVTPPTPEPTAEQPAVVVPDVLEPAVAEPAVVEPEVLTPDVATQIARTEVRAAADPVSLPSDKAVTLKRPKWVPKYEPAEAPPATTEAESAAVPEVTPPPVVEAPPQTETEGFTLRFESDAALTQAVAASHVGLYAIESDRAQRMTVSESRISFWDASTPNTFHEMEVGTVPAAVIDALSRTGTEAGTVSWGVTLPGKLTSQLDSLMQAHSGGSLIIGARGEIRWEAS